MVGNVSLKTTTNVPQTTEKQFKESNNFNKLLKGKIESNDVVSKVEENTATNNCQDKKVDEKDGFAIDEVLSTVTTKVEEADNASGNEKLQEVINSLAALLDILKRNISTENIPQEEKSNLNIQGVMQETPNISLILNENTNVVQQKSTSENLIELNNILGGLAASIEDGSINIIENKEQLSVLQGLLKDINVELQDINNIINNQKTSIKVDSINVVQIPEDSKVKVLDNVTDVLNEETTETIQRQLTNIISVKGTDVSNLKNVNTDTTVLNNVINKFEQLKTAITNVKVESTTVQEIQTMVFEIKGEVNKLLEETKTLISKDGTKVASSENEIFDFKIVTKLNLEGDTSKNNSSSGDDNSKGNIAKEDKLLNSILKDKEELPTARFTLLNNNNINSTQAVNQTGTTIINKETIAQDVIKNVKYMVTDGIKELTVKINPKELGEVVISLVQEGGAMKASIKAASKDTYNILAQNMSEIKKNLAEQNIKIQEVDISFNQDMGNYKGDSFSSSNFQGREGNNRFQGKNTNNLELGGNEENEDDYYSEEISNLNMLV